MYIDARTESNGAPYGHPRGGSRNGHRRGTTAAVAQADRGAEAETGRAEIGNRAGAEAAHPHSCRL